jgi:hypothetical protein
MPDNLVVLRLASQIRQAGAIRRSFHWSRFFAEAQSWSGKRLPTARQLTTDLWEIAFPGEDHDGFGLQDTFEAAVSQAQNATSSSTVITLTVEPAALAEHYRV